MKLATVRVANQTHFGVVEGDNFKSLSAQLNGYCRDLRELIAKIPLSELAERAISAPVFPLNEIEFLPPIGNADARIWAIGWSYGDHQAETGKPAPEHPFFFLKSPYAVVGHGQAIERPLASEKFDFEAEIAIVLGRGGRHIKADQARDHIAGYGLFMDGSIRDWQQHSVTAGKNFDRSSAFGPYIVTTDEISDPGSIRLSSRLNGNSMQSTLFSEMVWDLGYLIAYLSEITELRAGDIISTGTPAGVGHKRKPPVFMQPGDVLEIEGTGLGVLRNLVVNG